MSQQLLIQISSELTQVATLINHHVVELQAERPQQPRVGNIYRGKVVRILPGMAAAFVDIGLARSALLPFKGVVWPKERGYTQAQQYLRVGLMVCVQLVTLPRGDKGAIVRQSLRLVGNYLVYQPLATHSQLAKRISDSHQRQRLIFWLKQHQASRPSSGWLVRTKAQQVDTQLLAQEAAELQRVWCYIQTEIDAASSIGLIRQELALSYRCLREATIVDIDEIVVDQQAEYQQLKQYVQQWLPSLAHCLRRYKGQKPLLVQRQVEPAIQQALSNKVNLPGGGYLLIESTQALISIDVNTGSCVAGQNYSVTIMQTNIEAAVVLAKQLRLRNLSGIIIVDFITLETEQQRQQVIAALRTAVADDRCITQLSDFSALGLVEMARQRRGPELSEVL